MSFFLMIAKRIGWILPVGLGVVTLTFFIARVFGGDPVEQYLPADADEQLRATVRASLGLDRSMAEQYVSFVIGLFRGDLGTSFTTGRPVMGDLIQRLPATVELAIWGLVIGVFLGVVLGVIAAVNRDRFPDFLIRGVTVGGMSLPSFWIGLVLIFIFAVTIGSLPGPVGRLPIGVSAPEYVTGLLVVDSIIAGDGAKLTQSIRHLVLPATTLALAVLAPIARVTRNSMVEALSSEYIRTAYATGHGKARVWFVYALRNALLPVITIFGEVLAFTLGGAVLIEAVFGWPGIGKYALQAIQTADFGALQGIVLYSALLYVVAYLLIDVLYLSADPRTRIGVKA